MYAANIGQIHNTNPADSPFNGWVVFLRLGGNTAREKAIRAQHEAIETDLAEGSVSYSEITTQRGKDDIYERVACSYRKHPLFLVLRRHPSKSESGEPYLVVEWGKWTSIDNLIDDLFRLLPLVNSGELMELMTIATAGEAAITLRTLIERGNYDEMKEGSTISLGYV